MNVKCDDDDEEEEEVDEVQVLPSATLIMVLQLKLLCSGTLRQLKSLMSETWK